MMNFAKKCLMLFFAVTLVFAFQAITLSVATTTALATDLEPVCTATWGGEHNDQAWDVIKVGDYLYVTGHKGTATDPTYTYDLFVRKYAVGCDATWEEEWEETWNNGPKDAGFVIVSDGSYLYVGGITYEENRTKALLQKRNLSNSSIVWTQKWGDVAGHYYEVDGLAIYGNYIYVSHWDQVSYPYSIKAVVRKFDLNGNEQSGGFPYTIDDSSADGHIYADSTGVYVAGRTLNSTTWDAYVAKIDPDDATLNWFKTWGDVNYNQALSLASDGSYLYLSGQTNTGGSNPNAILLKYEMDDGDLADETVQDDYIDFSRGIFVDTNYIYMSVYSQETVNDPGYTTLVTYNKSNTEAPVDERVWGDGVTDERLATSLYADNVYIYMVGKTTDTEYGDYDARLIKVERPTP